MAQRKRRKKTFRRFTDYSFQFLFITVVCFGMLRNVFIKENLSMWLYDLRNFQERVAERSEIDAILDQYKVVSFSELPNEYLDYTLSNKKEYQNLLENKQFIELTGTEVFKYVAGNFRIQDFLPKDKYYKKNMRNLRSGSKIYWLVDRKLLYKTLQLQSELKKRGYVPDFKLVNGHRHPQDNIRVGGASQSRHITGQAVDISIGDVNNDGKRTQADKDIILDLLENYIIGNEGGIGRYPNSMSVHYDVRGHRARWDKH